MTPEQTHGVFRYQGNGKRGQGTTQSFSQCLHERLLARPGIEESPLARFRGKRAICFYFLLRKMMADEEVLILNDTDALHIDTDAPSAGHGVDGHAFCV